MLFYYCKRETLPKTEVSAETYVEKKETLEEQQMQSDYHLNYEEFMQLSDEDKIIDLYYRLWNQEEKLKELESRLNNHKSSTSMFGNVPSLVLGVSSILAFAYIIRKKLQL